MNLITKTLISCLFIGLISTFSLAQKATQYTGLFKISVGAYQFKDRFKLVKNTVGYSVGLSYEKSFARHWSFVSGFELCQNNNAIPELKKTSFSPINLPEKEQRIAIANELRYYLSKRGLGFYFSNNFAVLWQRNSEVSVIYDCINCPNNSLFIYSTFAQSDRLAFGYQNFIHKEMILGISISYEWRLIALHEIVRSPQVAIHLGFAN